MIWIVPAVDSLWTEVKMPPKKIKEKRGKENVAFFSFYTYSTEKKECFFPRAGKLLVPEAEARHSKC